MKKASAGIKSPQVLTRLSILVENYLNYKMKIYFDRKVSRKYYSALSVVISYSLNCKTSDSNFNLISYNNDHILRHNIFADALMKDMSGRRDWLKKQSKLKADEKKRRGTQKTHADIFGMEGSFRQLNID